jgi:hypothetical protein
VTTDAATISEAEELPKAPADKQLAGTRAKAAAAWQMIERGLVHAGDWLNPILVKETRQALKSFQFTVTFVLLLVACWVITMGGVAIIGPRIFYAAEGSNLILWYYAILAFPLAVVVPYAAYRSLAAEREDNTYDLLSITALRPRQIISGKLGSAMVQMAVYFSAITPCLAFTYLLRGIDVPTIALLLTYLFFWSLGLSMVGILLATLTKRRFAQVFVSVAFVGALFLMFYFVYLTSIPMIQYSYSYLGSEEFWTATLALATAYVTTFALAYFAAAGMITFTSENRSTPLRACMIIQQAAFLGWVAYGWILSEYEVAVILAAATGAGIYWYAMGTMVTAERPGLSQRVRRQLPQSFLGRMFLSWLNPGPSTGYMFVVANATMLALVLFVATMVSSIAGTGFIRWPNPTAMAYLLLIGWGYLVGYLGIGLLVIGALRRVAIVTMLACVLIHFLLLLAGFGIPYAIKSMSVSLRELDYSFMQISDPFCTLIYIGDTGFLTDAAVVALVVPGVALCVLLLNMPGVIRELRVVREAPPPRVLEDEAELHPPPEALPSSPWDEPD